MCGLIGMVSKNQDTPFTEEDIKKLEYAMFWNQRRGTHSTGLGHLSRFPDGHSGYLKGTGSFVDLVGDSKYPKTIQEIQQNCVAVIGHGRSATIGKVSTDNAHPFKVRVDEREIIFAHNGTLYHKQTLPDFLKYETDSEWLAAMIAKYGPEEAIPKIDGAMACLWVDLKDRSFNAYHNSQRPLCWLQGADELMYLSSTKDILEYIGFLTKTKLTNRNCIELQEDMLFTWTPNSDGIWVLKETTIKSMTFSYPSSISDSKGWGEDYSAGYTARARTTTPETTSVTTTIDKPITIRHRKNKIISIGTHTATAKVGQRILLEAVETSDMMGVQAAMNKVYGVRASGPIEGYLNYIFYTPMTTEKVMEHRYFTGEVGAIVAVPGTTPTQYECYMKDVHPTTDAEILELQ